jgi:hypothetical protein
MDRNGGLQLTTKKIRSKNSHRNADLYKQLKNSFRHSVVNAKRRKTKQNKNEKILELALEILKKCENALEPVDYDELKRSISELDASYKSIATNPLFANAKDDNDEEIENVNEEKKSESNVKRRTARTAVKKTLSKSQASFKKKLDRLTETIRIVESNKKIIESLRKQIIKNEQNTMHFKKQLCVEMKANFDPLFGGAIGYENCSRTDPYGDNLSKSVWDSKTSKPS